MKNLSVVVATRNEEKNIGGCLESVEEIADEVIVLDENSDDRTAEIARKYGAKVYLVRHEPVFHVTKQKALEKASGRWILQLDADERVSVKLAKEIRGVVAMSDAQRMKEYESKIGNYRLFKRHQDLLEKKRGKIGKETGEIVAYFLPRRNFFLGKPLIHAGVYPDGVIRLVKKGKARFPAKSVHEQMEIDGEVGWLFNDLEHHDSPTLRRYLERLNRYTTLHSRELGTKNAPKNVFYLLYYSIFLACLVFLRLYLRHKGFLDGIRGFLWSALSASHYPIAYFKYYTGRDN